MNWLEEIEEFISFSEYDRFTKFLETRLIENDIEEIETKRILPWKKSIWVK